MTREIGLHRIINMRKRRSIPSDLRSKIELPVSLSRNNLASPSNVLGRSAGRRLLVARLYLLGLCQESICDVACCSVRTMHYDVKAVIESAKNLHR